MKPIDFVEKFKNYIHQWSREHLTGDETDEEIEEKQLEEYEKWLVTPKDWLKGKSPDAYFGDIQDPNEIVKLLVEYIISGIAVPEPMDNRLIEMKETVYPMLIYILEVFNEGEKQAAERLKVKIINLISEMGKPHPFRLYIDWIRNAVLKSDLTEEAAHVLSEGGDEQKTELIKAYQASDNEYASDCFIDILSNYPGDPYIVEMIIERFENTNTKKAFYANCLGKLGDPDTLQSLYNALNDRQLDYFDYTAIKYAIEELGGSVEIDRDFTGDKDYEKLIKL